MITGSISAPGADQEDSIYGVLLLGGFLVVDSFTSTFQEKLFRDYKTTKYNQMIYVNICSAAISLVSLAAAGELLVALRFSQHHRRFDLDAIAISVASVVGQFFIVSMVKEFGALVLAATMNVRQLISLIGSYVIYKHPMTAQQIISLVA